MTRSNCLLRAIAELDIMSGHVSLAVNRPNSTRTDGPVKRAVASWRASARRLFKLAAGRNMTTEEMAELEELCE